MLSGDGSEYGGKMPTLRTQVAIIGGGPSGLMLSQLLNIAGIDTVLLERQTQAYVEGRIRAGVLESGTVEMLHQAGIGDRVSADGHVHDGCLFAAANKQFRVDFKQLTGKQITVYGQTEVTKDLYRAQQARGATHIFEVSDVVLDDLLADQPKVEYRKDGVAHTLHCDFIAGCDGFHGVSRQSIPADGRTEFERVYPFGWLGILSETRPAADELIYANHQRGFALLSMRNPTLSRSYIQVPVDEDIAAWSDDRYWDELKRRVPEEVADGLQTGPSIEKSIAPLRSFVCETMQYGRLFLCGDAAHIVPPTGAKGLNLAMSDVHYLSGALISHYQDKDRHAVAHYTPHALARVWKATRFSWWMTTTLHRFPDQTEFDQRIQEAELAYISQSPTAQAMLAENYVGLPF